MTETKLLEMMLAAPRTDAPDGCTSTHGRAGSEVELVMGGRAVTLSENALAVLGRDALLRVRAALQAIEDEDAQRLAEQPFDPAALTPLQQQVWAAAFAAATVEPGAWARSPHRAVDAANAALIMFAKVRWTVGIDGTPKAVL